MKKSLIIFIGLILLIIHSCDIHEFPEQSSERVPFTLHLIFDTELPLHKEIAYTRNSNAPLPEEHDIRYIIKAYRNEDTRTDNREADTTMIFTKSDLCDLDYSVTFFIREGTYTFRVWADYVKTGTKTDNYYDTRDFAEIILADKEQHIGSNDYKDAFRGYVTASVRNPRHYPASMAEEISNEATVDMMRPMGAFMFISTDVEVFLTRVLEMIKEKDQRTKSEIDTISNMSIQQQMQNINLNDFTVVFRYNAFMPCSFNMFTDKPADAWTGMWFNSWMQQNTDSELILGYDYLFVNGNETTLSISLEVYNDEGKLLASTNPINVPIVRSKITIVTGEFLTSKATGGITINPSYEDNDYNIEIR